MDSEELEHLGEKDLTNYEHNLLQILKDQNVANSAITRVMNELVQQRNVTGSFLPKTILNMTKKIQDASHLVSGIGLKWSVAQKHLRN